MPPRQIRTRFLIISDTHGASLHDEHDSVRPPPSPRWGARSSHSSPSSPSSPSGPPILHGFRRPLPSADVAIHCGDLTKHSRPDEYAATVALLREVDAPLKLAIPGNHDTALDRPVWAELQSFMRGPGLGPDLGLGRGTGGSADPAGEYPDRVAALLDRARREDGIRFLDEGTYTFVLPSGARLCVFASPHTPSFGFWAFQYTPGRHDFAIPRCRPGPGSGPPAVDVVVSHGPPRGVLDTTLRGESAGCAALLAASAAARPRLHCFGHIHESWGARLVDWHDGSGSRDVELLADVDPAPARRHGDGDGDEGARRAETVLRHNGFAEQRCRPVSLCGGDGERALEPGRETLFVNAAIMDLRYEPVHLPWLVDVELQEATEEERQRAEETAGLVEEALQWKSVCPDPYDR